jgi:Rrf2 family transcriptional regulator, nitric oxide-sensitive transcriptional repressor
VLSQTCEYALRAVVFLADHQGEANTTEAIAEVTKIPVGYLAKIMQILAKAGLVSSQRGLHGGFTLERSPKDITMYEVMQCIDPIARITECPLKYAEHGTNLCSLHRRLDNAMQAVEVAFRKTTIAQLLAEESSNRPLCAFPRVGSEASSKKK